MFSCGPENIHRFRKLHKGTRYLLTIWFTRDEKFNEDRNLIAGGMRLMREMNCDNSIAKVETATGENAETQETKSFELNPLYQTKFQQLGITHHAFSFQTGTSVTISDTKHKIPYIFANVEDLFDFLSFCLTFGDIKAEIPMPVWKTLMEKWQDYKKGYIQKIKDKLEKWEQMNQLCD